MRGDDTTKFAYFAKGTPYPKKLIPKFDKSSKCKHDNSFDSANPVLSGWIFPDKAKIHCLFISILCCILSPYQGRAI